MGVAFFDMDGTIVGGDTNDLSIGHFVKLGLADESIIKSLKIYGQMFFQGTLDINEFVKFAVKPLVGMPKDKLNEILSSTVRYKIIPVVKPGALRQIDFHNKRGDRIVIVTSTMDYLVEHVAKQLNISDYIAAPMEKIDGVLSGAQCGIVPFQQDKVTRINTFLKDNNLSLEDSYAYGDTINDLPMINMCQHKFAVDPNEVLLKSEDIKELEIVDWTK